jgi:hypothetical protein
MDVGDYPRVPIEQARGEFREWERDGGIGSGDGAADLQLRLGCGIGCAAERTAQRVRIADCERAQFLER